MYNNFLYVYSLNLVRSLYTELIIDTAPIIPTDSISINEDTTNLIVDSNGNNIVLNGGQ